MSRYKSEPKRRSYRKLGWDYGGNGAYFITICTNKRRCFFGRGVQRKIKLTTIGNIAKELWLEIPNHYPYVRLGEFVVMPNHIHGIIIIDKKSPVGTHDCASDSELDCASDSELESASDSELESASDSKLESASDSELDSSGEYKNLFGAQSRNLAAIIRAYKASVTRESRKVDKLFAWQGRFHDRIIRNEIEYRRIANYIINNPRNWFK